MSDRLRGAYWKLWHDARGRFMLALALVLLGMAGAFGGTGMTTHRPHACSLTNTNLSWSAMRDELQTEIEQNQQRSPGMQYMPVWAGTFASYGIPGPRQIADADILNTHCSDDERPSLGYAASVQIYTRNARDTTWGAMTYLFLFVGVLLSVGSPFSGESMEAFSLTFSLPWSRERWLVTRVALSVIMLIVLMLVVAIIAGVCTYFPYMSQMRGGFPADDMAREIGNIAHPSLALLAGLVGISLGTAASLFTRNVLTAAVAASLVAYVLIGMNFEMPTGLGGLLVLPMILNGNIIVAALVLGIACLVISTRLRTTDF